MPVPISRVDRVNAALAAARTTAQYKAARALAGTLSAAESFDVIDGIIAAKLRLGLPCGQFHGPALRRGA